MPEASTQDDFSRALQEIIAGGSDMGAPAPGVAQSDDAFSSYLRSIEAELGDEAAARRAAQPKETQSMLSKLGSGALTALDYTGGIGRTMAATHPLANLAQLALTGKHPSITEQRELQMSGLRGEAPTGPQIFEQKGVPEMGSMDTPFGKITGRDVAGFAFEMGTDPLSAGAGAITKGSKALFNVLRNLSKTRRAASAGTDVATTGARGMATSKAATAPSVGGSGPTVSAGSVPRKQIPVQEQSLLGPPSKQITGGKTIFSQGSQPAYRVGPVRPGGKEIATIPGEGVKDLRTSMIPRPGTEITPGKILPGTDIAKRPGSKGFSFKDAEVKRAKVEKDIPMDPQFDDFMDYGSQSVGDMAEVASSKIPKASSIARATAPLAELGKLIYRKSPAIRKADLVAKRYNKKLIPSEVMDEFAVSGGSTEAIFKKSTKAMKQIFEGTEEIASKADDLGASVDATEMFKYGYKHVKSLMKQRDPDMQKMGKKTLEMMDNYILDLGPQRITVHDALQMKRNLYKKLKSAAYDIMGESDKHALNRELARGFKEASENAIGKVIKGGKEEFSHMNEQLGALLTVKRTLYNEMVKGDARPFISKFDLMTMAWNPAMTAAGKVGDLLKSNVLTRAGRGLMGPHLKIPFKKAASGTVKGPGGVPMNLSGGAPTRLPLADIMARRGAINLGKPEIDASRPLTEPPP